VAVAARLGVPLDAAVRGLLDWRAPAMRMEVLTTPAGVTVLSDAYNAAPDSMAGALEALRDFATAGKKGRHVAVLGEMRELGGFAADGYRAVGHAVALAAPDVLVLVGPAAAAVEAAARERGYDVAPANAAAAAVHRFATTDEAAAALPALVSPGDAVLVKGSRALAMERIVAALGAEPSAAASSVAAGKVTPS
jgi:UDP-N-acetylmuramoyl-tripeptide--D-alanyl-D-alanine ligase